VGSALVAVRSRGLVLSFLYWSLRRLLELLVIRRRSEREKEIEILLLGHQLRVLERQLARFAADAGGPSAAGCVQPCAAPGSVEAIVLGYAGNTAALAS